jgi:hypothetical protein
VTAQRGGLNRYFRVRADKEDPIMADNPNPPVAPKKTPAPPSSFQPGESNARAVRLSSSANAAPGAAGAGPLTAAPAAAAPLGETTARQRVRMLTAHEGHAAGAELEVEPAVGQRWIDAGAAEAIPADATR